MDSNAQDTEESITGDIAGEIDKSNINGSESENDAEIQTANVELVSDPNSTLRKNKSSDSVATKDDTLITDWNAAVSSLPAQPPLQNSKAIRLRQRITRLKKSKQVAKKVLVQLTIPVIL